MDVCGMPGDRSWSVWSVQEHMWVGGWDSMKRVEQLEKYLVFYRELHAVQSKQQYVAP